MQVRIDNIRSFSALRHYDDHNLLLTIGFEVEVFMDVAGLYLPKLENN